MIEGAMGRLLAPRSVALCGGIWADAAAAACRALGYRGTVWRIHPKRASSAAQRYYRSVDELPEAPDATFIAAPALEAPAIAASLARRGAGGFVCFASGFAETGTTDGMRLAAELTTAAGTVPYLGPNCYGFVNFFDRCALWPDQIVGVPPERGVALICQSGTIALDLLFNRRSLPIGYVLTVGNQSRLAVEDLIAALADDTRVTAFGLYVEGVRDIARFARAIDKARRAGKPVALVKAGRTESASRTVHSHTGSLAGSDAAFDAFCRQSGLARCDTLATLCETLKVLHGGGPLRGRSMLLLGASGGDTAMAADTARGLELRFPPFPAQTSAELRALLTDRVTISNPFDFHTHVWFDRPALQSLFSIAHGAGYDAVGLLIDCPPTEEADASGYLAVIEEFAAASARSPSRAMLISSLPESLPAQVRARCLAAGIAPLQGQREALEALDLAALVGVAWSREPRVELLKSHRPLQPDEHRGEPRSQTLPEYAGKAALAASGVPIPVSRLVTAADAADAAAAIGFPVVIKATGPGLEHKTEVGGVVLNVSSPADAAAAAARLSRLAGTLLVEQMITDGVAEILVGIKADAQFGQLLVLGAGGVLAELIKDRMILLPPFNAADIERACARLAVGRLLAGYRGGPPGDLPALAQAAMACARYAQQNLDRLIELDLNPVIVRPAGRGAVAVDALIRLIEEP